MIGLAVACVRLPLRLSFALMDMMFVACTLGKVDPRTRRFF